MVMIENEAFNMIRGEMRKLGLHINISKSKCTIKMNCGTELKSLKGKIDEVSNFFT